ncbi:MAG: ABC transporter ATP-binding protein [Zetaproteobacteria bacterium]|nr:MAG: ABC transporter ATP-binding protein [Zetaproteobacteria bacterium]
MNALEVDELRKCYRPGRVALEGLSLTVARGGFYALLGPNGAGKSTLINILADTVRPTSGRVRLFGDDLFRHRIRCKRRMGVVPQEAAFDPFFTPREILSITSGLYGCRPDRRWIETLLDALDLAAHADRNTRQLSGGMRRRLLVAQALVHRPELVILDEPTAGVDVELRRRLWEFMRRLNREGTTILLTTHYLEEAEQLCDGVAIIDQGRLLTAGAMRTLMEQVATSWLVLSFGQRVAQAALAREPRLAPFGPEADGEGRLRLRLMRNPSNFHDAYQAATACFGPPVDATIEHEDLEDVFLRLTGG